MERYIEEHTVGKYSIERSGQFDLMSITQQPIICIWNILRYSFRIWNNSMKERDLGKIAHYAELAWTLSEGKIIKNDRDNA